MLNWIEGYFIITKVSKSRTIIPKRIWFDFIELLDVQNFPAIFWDSYPSDISIFKRHCTTPHKNTVIFLCQLPVIFFKFLPNTSIQCWFLRSYIWIIKALDHGSWIAATVVRIHLMSSIISGFFIILIQIGKLRYQRIRLELFRAPNSLLTIEHIFGQPIFNDNWKALWLTEGNSIVLVMDCDGVLFLCQILRTNFYWRKDIGYSDNDESVQESPVIPKHGILRYFGHL